MLRDVAKGVAKNTSILMFQQLITWGSTFLLMLFLARYLGPQEYGRLYLANSIVEVFRVVVIFGAQALIVKKVSRQPEQTSQILVDSIALRVLLGLVSIGAIQVVAHIADYSAEVRLLLLIFGFSLLWAGASSSLTACYQGHELMQYTSIGTVVERFFMSASNIVLLLLGYRANMVALGSITATFLNVAVLFGLRKKIIDTLPPVNWGNVFRQIKEGMPYFLQMLFSVIYYRIDAFMLSIMTTTAVIGWYGGAYRLFDMLSFIPYLFTIAIYPVLSRLWVSESNAHRLTTHKIMEFMIVISIPMMITMASIAPDLVNMFYGLAGYQQSILVYRILLLGLPILYVDFMLSTTLLSSDKQKEVSVVSLVAIPVNVILNILLIPYTQDSYGNGGIGAAIATVITEVGIMIAFLNLIPKGLLSGFRTSVIFKSGMAGGIAGGVLWFLSTISFFWPARAAISFLLYIVVVFILKTFEQREQDLFFHLFTSEGFAKLRALIRTN